MMIPKFYLLMLYLIVMPSLVFPQILKFTPSKIDEQITDEIVQAALSEARGYDWLRELCAIGPRLSGSANSEKAIEWALRKFNEIGVDTAYLQPVKVPVWVRGIKEKAEIIESEGLNKELNIASLGGSIPTRESGLTAEVVEVAGISGLAGLGNSVEGKIVFFNEAFDHGILNTFSAYGKAVAQRVKGPSEAARLGAVGVIVRSVTSKHDNVPHVGMLSYAEDAPKIPAAAIGLEDADYLSRALSQDPNLKISMELDCGNYPDRGSFNVIAEIKGTEKPEDIIVVGGHFDSWDKGCGAHDAGACCIQTMEVLDIFKRLEIKPKRTIRCVLFINEENGIRGALKYAEESEKLREKHLAAIESDRGVFTPRGFNFTGDSLSLSNLQAFLPLLSKSRIEWIRAGGSGPDVAQIKNAKGLFGYVPDDQRYFDYHHSANDTFESVNFREMQLGTAAIAILTYLLSEHGF